jgi:hypothetical protein
MNRMISAITVIFLLFGSGCLISTNSYGGSAMEPSYLYELKNIKGDIPLEPQKFKSKSRNISLFPVPQDSSVGTNDIGNAITLISFTKAKISYDKYFRNAVEDIGGGGTYIPVISPDVIGFGQVRIFLIYDFKKKIHREFRLFMSIGKSIDKIAIADARQRHFIFEIEKELRGSNDAWAISKSLHLFDLSGDKPILLKEMAKDTGVVWSVVSDKNFLYDFETERVRVLNMNFEPADHPLADQINKNKGNLSFTWIHSHPLLPFAILAGGENGSTFIGWGESRAGTPHLLASRVKQFSFSPDGKWVVFRKDFDLDTTKTYLMPVSEKYPHYLGSPILLSNGSFGENNVAWTTNPISLVASRLDEIYRWELTNQAHPESDKATFHDYIVGKDLEKLTKEKRQGLGGQQ